MNNFLVSKTLNDTYDHDTRDRMLKNEKNLGKKFVNRNGNVVPL
jgi:GGDEF domain-containing protein